MPKEISIAKITRPRVTNVLLRTRLFRMLDECRKAPVTWVSGPAGSGKTTLVASYIDARRLPCLWYHIDEGDADLAGFFYYLGIAAKKAAPRIKKPLPHLTPEYLQGIPTFTKRYFENVCSRLKPPFVIVFDNYHYIPPKAAFHDMIRNALSVIPEGIHVIINSRGVPPSSLALMTTYGKLQAIGWDDLKFDRNEIEGLFKSEQRRRPDNEFLKRIETMTTGWAAGIVLMLQRLKTFAPAVRERERFKPEEIFDYFAAELFEKADPETQNFLLKTSFLPRISPNAAALLTGNTNAGRLLGELSQNHFFTERRSLSDPVYQYHPLFNHFLQARAKETMSPNELLKVQRRAAESLERSGQREDAAELYRISKAWNGLVRIILANAQAMTSQGRNRTLEAWLNSVPASLFGKDPWLLYWLGMCRMPSNPTESHGYFERSLTLFRKKNNAAGAFRSWSGAIESMVQEMGDIKRLDRWVALAFDLMKRYDFPSREIEDEITARIFTAMPWNPADPNFVTWRKRAMLLIESDADPSLRLMTATYLVSHHIWIGDYPTARIALDVCKRLAKIHENISPLAYCMGRMCEGWFSWHTGDHGRSYSIIQDALARAKESGVHIWDRNLLQIGAAANLCKGDVSEAGRLLEQMAVGQEHARLFDRFYYHLNSAWRFMMMGEIRLALTHQKQAHELEMKTGFPINSSEIHFGMAVIMTASEKPKKAKEHAAELHRIAGRMGSALVKYRAHIADAFLSFKERSDETGLQSLREALKLSREREFVYFNWWIPSMMTDLCMRALEAGIEAEHVRYLIRNCGLAPEEPPVHIEYWPWPVKIFTLGDFAILLDDKRIVFSGKVQKKPLEMLKALIALGGNDIREDQLHDALWPDAEGDSAGTSFRATLHRLRQLIGNEKAVVVREGRVSLDRRYCWVDAWAFEKAVGSSEFGVRSEELQEKQKANHNQSEIAHLEKALALYRGHFLETDEDKPWTTSARERLRSKFLRAVKGQGDYWRQKAEFLKKGDERKSAIKKAVECYERGLEVDDVAEEFYQNLMTCHEQLGAKAEALKVYKRCKTALSAAFGVEPSKEIEEIYQKIVGKDDTKIRA